MTDTTTPQTPEKSEKWKISYGAIQIGDIEIGDEHGDIVVTVHTMMRRYSKNAAKAWATANLIEAAPDLLDALKALGATGEPGFCFCRDQKQMDNGHTGECREACAAIAKAKKGKKS